MTKYTHNEFDGMFIRRIGILGILIGVLGVVAASHAWSPDQGARRSSPPSEDDYVIPHEGQGDVNPKEAADIVAIEQIWSAYAHYLDSRDPEGVASLFTPTGGYVLSYANRETGQVEPLGRSPSSDGVSGTPGGGCTALGHDAIVAFLGGSGRELKFPGLSKHVVVNKWIHVHGDKATMKAYWLGGNPVESRGLYDNTFVRTRQGWKAQRNEVIFDVNNPTRACAN